MFAREVDGSLARLVKKLDELCKSHQGTAKLCVFVVVMTDDKAAATKALKELAKREGITHVPLTLFTGTKGPRGYNVSADAGTTVVLWKRTRVTSTHGFAAGSLDEAGVEAVVADVKKLIGVAPAGKKPATQGF